MNDRRKGPDNERIVRSSADFGTYDSDGKTQSFDYNELRGRLVDGYDTDRKVSWHKRLGSRRRRNTDSESKAGGFYEVGSNRLLKIVWTFSVACLVLSIPLHAIRPHEIFGYPAHASLIHFAVVLLPLSALVMIASIWWASVRRRYAPMVLLLAGFGIITMVLAFQSGYAVWDQIRQADVLVTDAERDLVGQHLYASKVLLATAYVYVIALVVLYFGDVLTIRGDRDSNADSGLEKVGIAVMRTVAALLGVALTVSTLWAAHFGARASWEERMNRVDEVVALKEEIRQDLYEKSIQGRIEKFGSEAPSKAKEGGEAVLEGLNSLANDAIDKLNKKLDEQPNPVN